MFWVAKQPFFLFALFAKRVASQTMKALTVILSVCDAKPVITPLEAANVLLHSNTSVMKMLKYCSHNKLQFQTTIFPHYVQIPCPQSVANCDISSWADRADNAIRPFIPVDKFIYRIYILPKGGCSFAGLGVIGPCSKNKICRIWISGHYANQPSTYVHELGHNLGLNHASYKGDEYGDFSDVMGYCCINRCFNAPHSNMLNFTQARNTFYIPLESIYTLTLEKNEYIQIHDPLQFTTWFIQNRQPSGLDKLPISFTGLNVYSTTFSHNPTGLSTLHIILGRSGETFSSNFVLHLINITNSKAHILLTNPTK